MWSCICPFPSPYLSSFCHCFYEESPCSLSLFIFLNFHNAYVGVPIATYAFPLIFTLPLFLIPSVEQFNAFLPEPDHCWASAKCCISGATFLSLKFPLPSFLGISAFSWAFWISLWWLFYILSYAVPILYTFFSLQLISSDCFPSLNQTHCFIVSLPGSVYNLSN